jgi:hypothetical protein
LEYERERLSKAASCRGLDRKKLKSPGSHVFRIGGRG